MGSRIYQVTSKYSIYRRSYIKNNAFKEKGAPTNSMAKKVLVIEYNEAILDVLKIIITDAGYHFIDPPSPVTLEKIFDLQPDIILIEDQLHNLQHGRKICRSLKRSPLTSSIHMVIMTTSIKPEDLILESEADALLIKPFDIEDLEKILRCFSENNH